MTPLSANVGLVAAQETPNWPVRNPGPGAKRMETVGGWPAASTAVATKSATLDRFWAFGRP
jgi:hypothetical protein